MCVCVCVSVYVFGVPRLNENMKLVNVYCSSRFDYIFSTCSHKRLLQSYRIEFLLIVEMCVCVLQRDRAHFKLPVVGVRVQTHTDTDTHACHLLFFSFFFLN